MLIGKHNQIAYLTVNDLVDYCCFLLSELCSLVLLLLHSLLPVFPPLLQSHLSSIQVHWSWCELGSVDVLRNISTYLQSLILLLVLLA